jgi:hypothetical protein
VWFEVGTSYLDLDFSQIQNQQADMSDGQSQTLKLNMQDLLSYSQAHGALHVLGDVADTVQILNGGDVLAGSTQVVNNQVFSAYDLNHDNVHDLLILQSMNQAQFA